MTIFRVSFLCQADETRLHRMLQAAAYAEGLTFKDIRVQSQQTYEGVREQELVERVNMVIAEALKPIRDKLTELDRRMQPDDFMD